MMAEAVKERVSLAVKRERLESVVELVAGVEVLRLICRVVGEEEEARKEVERVKERVRIRREVEVAEAERRGGGELFFGSSG